MSGGYYSPFAPNAQQTAKPASGSKSMGSETMNIRLTVVNGKQLKAKDLFTSDPYVIVSVGIEQRKTKTIMKNLNPTWGDSFEFYNVTPGTMATFTVMDYDKHGKDDPMGNASLVLQKLQPGHMATNELPLSTKGSICVQYTIISNPSSAKQSAGSYPQQQPGAYPPQQGYPQQQQGGYPPQQGYGQPGAYPGYPPQGGYPPQQPGAYPGYPPRQGYGQPGAYPPQQGGYPPQQPGAYPGYPPQQGYGQPGAYPGYPPQQPGYPQPGAYPGYPPQQGAPQKK
uniref:C2 domain protein, putative n=1 Tax=Entamoeba histolytica TaxID=5759 RepID=A0A060N487_ENTHI|nr:C2 domain protein, putative [Entamoeba histolytica]